MRRAANLDGNHHTIVEALEAAGCLVQSLASLGDGVPDLLVSLRGELWLLEIKDGSKPPSKRQLTTDQKEWHRRWARAVEKGRVVVVHDPQEALRAVGVVLAGPP